MSNASCSLPPQTLEARRQQLSQTLMPKVSEQRELPDGVAFRLPAGERAAAEAFIAFERGCCSFADYAIRDDGGHIWIEVTSERHADQIKRVFTAPAPAAKRRWLRTGIIGAVAAVVVCELPLIIAFGSTLLWCS